MAKARSILHVLVFAAGACAQVYVPDSSPSSGTVNYAPLGAKAAPSSVTQNMRTQIRVPASFLPAAGSTVVDVGFAGASTGYYTYAQLEVRLAHLASATLSTTFSSNLSGTTLVLQKSLARIDTLADGWKNAGLTGSFRHDGAHDMVLDIVIQGAEFIGTSAGTRRSSTLETINATGYSVAAPPATGDGPYLSGAKLVFTLQGGSVVVVGQGCPKADQKAVTIAAAGTVAVGSKLTLKATSATPSTSALLLIGTNETSFGSLSLPFDLGGVGAPGCLLRTDVAASPSVSADNGGAASIDLSIPNEATLRGKTLLFQWFAPAPAANTLQAVLSAMLRATIQ